jgi:hypothetical protein
MSITKCKECGGDVSTKAETCPHCGYRIRKNTGAQILSALIMIGFGALIIYASLSLLPHSVP